MPRRVLTVLGLVATLAVGMAAPAGPDLAAAATRLHTGTLAKAHCVPATPQGGGSEALLTNAHSGETVCLAVGQKLLVRLVAPAGSFVHWQRARLSRTGVLAVVPLGGRFEPNVTAQKLVAVRTGQVTLSSQRPACAPPRGSQMACRAILEWRATVVVTGSDRSPLLPQPPLPRA